MTTTQELTDAVERDLDVSTSLLGAGALTNADVVKSLHEAYDYATQTQAVNDQEAEIQGIVRSQLQSEIRIAEGLPSDGAADASQWPRQREAIERAYGFTQTNGDLLESAADTARARADVLNGMVDSAKKAAEGVGKGLETLLTVVIVLVVILSIATVAGKVRS
ncbi:MAG: hypothetical protein ACJ79H_10020 [Myxococcales bacterium]